MAKENLSRRRLQDSIDGDNELCVNCTREYWLHNPETGRHPAKCEEGFIGSGVTSLQQALHKIMRLERDVERLRREARSIN